jgi:hypothetical protein
MRTKRYFGCGELDDFMVRRKKRNTKDRSKRREFDVIAVRENYVFLNETKGNSQIVYMKKFIEFVENGEFFDYFPAYKDMKLLPIFSTLYLDESHIKFLSRNGIYAMALGEEMMDILNYEIEENE